MPDDPAQLAREARVFCAYLTGLQASEYVVAKYAAVHEAHALLDTPSAGAFDRLLLAFARWGGVATRLADVYAARFAKTSLLTHKLIVTVAILECAPSTYEVFDRPFRGWRAWTWVRLAARGGGEGLWLLGGALVLGPLHALLALAGAGRGKGVA